MIPGPKGHLRRNHHDSAPRILLLQPPPRRRAIPNQQGGPVDVSRLLPLLLLHMPHRTAELLLDLLPCLLTPAINIHPNRFTPLQKRDHRTRIPIKPFLPGIRPLPPRQFRPHSQGETYPRIQSVSSLLFMSTPPQEQHGNFYPQPSISRLNFHQNHSNLTNMLRTSRLFALFIKKMTHNLLVWKALGELFAQFPSLTKSVPPKSVPPNDEL